MNNFLKNKRKRILSLIAGFSPLNVFAARTNTIDSTNIKTLIGSLTKFFNSWLIGLIVLFALVNFVYSVMQYIAASEDGGDKKEKGKKVIWGIIALFVTLSVWALVMILVRTFGLTIGGGLKGWNS